MGNDSNTGALGRSSTRSSSGALAVPRGACADALSDVLRLVRLNGAVFLRAELGGPWAVRSPPSKVLAVTLMPQAECLIEYHFVLEGRCWVRVAGGDAVQLDRALRIAPCLSPSLAALVSMPPRPEK